MNALTDEPLIDHDALEREIVARDREVENPYTKDLQVTAIHGARRFLADRITRVAAPHRILDPDAGPLIAVRLSILTRKSLGGLQTDLSSRVLTASGEPLPASTPRARSRASAAAACTATARSRAPSSAAACSPAGPPGARPRRRSPSGPVWRAGSAGVGSAIPMTRRPATAVAAVVLAAIGLSAAPARAAAPTVIKGKLSRARSAAEVARKGEAQVIAMNVDTLAFGAAARVSKRGRYTLKLPAGKWALRTSVVALGKPFASFPSARIVARAGQRRSLPLTLKRFKKPLRVKRRARRANINPRDGRPYKGEAIGIERFSFVGSDPEFAPLGKGIPQMLITDLMQKPKCEFTLIEVMRRQEILNEHALSQSEYVDPASAIEPGHLIDPEILLRGRVEDRRGHLTASRCSPGSSTRRRASGSPTTSARSRWRPPSSRARSASPSWSSAT